MDTQMEFDFQDKLRTRNIVDVQGLALEGPGMLNIELRIGQKSSIWTAPITPMSQPALAAPVPDTTPVQSKSIKARKARKAKKRPR